MKVFLLLGEGKTVYTNVVGKGEEEGNSEINGSGAANAGKEREEKEK